MKDPLLAHLLQQSTEAHDQASPDALVVQLLRRCISQNELLLDEHSGIKEALASHVMNEETLVRGLIRAFPKKPDGSPDFDGHEAYHSALIEESRTRTLFYRELRLELFKKGAWSLVLILAALVVYWFTGQVRGPH